MQPVVVGIGAVDDPYGQCGRLPYVLACPFPPRGCPWDHGPGPGLPGGAGPIAALWLCGQIGTGGGLGRPGHCSGRPPFQPADGHGMRSGQGLGQPALFGRLWTGQPFHCPAKSAARSSPGWGQDAALPFAAVSVPPRLHTGLRGAGAAGGCGAFAVGRRPADPRGKKRHGGHLRPLFILGRWAGIPRGEGRPGRRHAPAAAGGTTGRKP